jgi:hypothetical protein
VVELNQGHRLLSSSVINVWVDIINFEKKKNHVMCSAFVSQKIEISEILFA